VSLLLTPIEPSSSGDSPSITVSAVHNNLDQEIIQVTCDRLKLTLSEYLSHIETRSAWITPASVALTTLAALSTAQFESFLNIEGPVWEAAFLLTFLASLAYLAYILIRMPKRRTVEDLVDSLRSQAVSRPES